MTASAARREMQQRWVGQLAPYIRRAGKPRPLRVEGRLARMVGLTLEARGCEAAVGDRCQVVLASGHPIEAEVVGFTVDGLMLMPIGEVRGLAPNARVIPAGRGRQVEVGPQCLGRVLDGAGRVLDGGERLHGEARMPLHGRPINPLHRHPIREPLDVGIRAINALLTVGQGQRVGLFAGSGVGKSVLLGMMTRYTAADVIVVGLIGERGREVNEFITEILGAEGRRRAVVVASPADDPPLLRLHGAALATTIAEYFRNQGLRVLLLMDSLTRCAQAQREIGLAIGEPPATRGYPPSVFAMLPQLVERAGNAQRGGGSITAFYTVLTEGEDPDDPLAEAARAILDGHVVLTRALAEQGHYPAIDLEASISRAMNAVATPAQLALARRFRSIYSTYQQHADIITVGAYQRGSDPRVDESIEMLPRMREFLRQDIGDAVDFAHSATALEALLGGAPAGSGA